ALLEKGELAAGCGLGRGPIGFEADEAGFEEELVAALVVGHGPVERQAIGPKREGGAAVIVRAVLLLIEPRPQQRPQRRLGGLDCCQWHAKQSRCPRNPKYIVIAPVLKIDVGGDSD